MSDQVYIYHHLGLGDHFHCNGVVRFLCKEKYNKSNVKLFAKKKYLEMIQFMYRDLPNFEVIPISNDEDKEKYEIESIVKNNDKLEKIGFDYFEKNKDKGKTIDMLFYEQSGLDYSKRFELTYWERNHTKEKKLYDELVKDENYVFVHDDPSRGFIIPDKLIPKKFQIIRNSNSHSIFDYSKIIENSKEIHVMESSMRCMLEYLETEKSKHYLYNFVNGPWKSMPYYNQENKMIGSSKNWIIKKINFKKRDNFFSKLLKFFKF
tara:strand:+ start:218 stop:1006 length:789 start_codon:yes stop_codon:yes gene_type:complete